MNIFDDYKKLVDEKNNFFDDQIFEEKCGKLLKKNIIFSDFDDFPLFKKTRSIYKNDVIQLDYYKVTLTVCDEIKIFYFLDDISNYVPINF